MAVTADYIVSGLTKRGIPRMAAIALAGSGVVESTLDPGINEINPLVKGSRGGFGLWQHTGPRRRQLEKFAASRNMPVGDADLQMDFVVWELANTEKAAASHIYKAKTIDDAARAVSERFLRPGIPHMDRRIKATRRIASGDTNFEITNVQQVDSANAPDYSRLTEAYNNGEMDDRQRAIYEAAVADGRVQASQPAASQPTAPPRAAPSRLVEAYRRGAVTPEQRTVIDNAVAQGQLQVPEGFQFGADLNPRDMSQEDRDAWNLQRGGQPGLQYLMPDRSDVMVPTAADAAPLPDRTFSQTREGQLDQTVNLSRPLFGAAGRAAQGALGSAPSVVGSMIEGAGFSKPVQNTIGRIGDAGLAAVVGVGGAIAGGAGLVGDAAEAVGVPRANLLGRDLAAFPEAIAGLIGSPVRAATTSVRRVDLPSPPRPSRLELDIAAAERNNIRVMTTDAFPPRTAPGRQIQAAGESIPLTGTGGPRAAQFAERQDAVRRVVDEFGGASTPIDDTLRNVSDDFIRQRSDRIGRYWQQKQDVIEGLPQDIPVDVTRTVARIDDEIAQLQSLRNPEFAPLVRQLEGWKGAIQNQSLSNIEQLRRQMGESFKSADLANISTRGEAAVRSIYGPLREDMGAFIRTNGARQDYNRWAVANGRLAEMAGELNITSLRNALRNAEETPETIGRMLFSSNSSDVRRLYRGLSQEGRDSARVAVFSRIVDKSTRDGTLETISPTRFANNIAKEGRAIGIMFNGEDRAIISGLTRALRLTEQADRAGLTPPTGVRAVPYVAFTAGTAATGSPVSAAALTGAVGGLARAYETPAARNILIRLSRARPGSEAEARYFAQLREMNFNMAPAGAATITGQQQSNAQ